MSYIRLNKFANNLEEVKSYYQDRARQVLWNGYIWTKEIQEFKDFSDETKIFGACTFFKKENKEYISVYLYNQYRGKGMFKSLTEQFKDKIFITVDDCNLEYYFHKNNFQYIKTYVCPIQCQQAYIMISGFYKDLVARRSQIPYMNHIDEGTFILRALGASNNTISAYMLHPIFQQDLDLKNTGIGLAKYIEEKEVLLFSMEYRNIANQYLSTRDVKNISEINLSPLCEVNIMLKADKIQNYKDFMTFHYGNHLRSEELKTYFLNWFEKLELDIDFVNKLINEIKIIEI